MHIPKLVCVKSRTEMVIQRTGIVIELKSDNGHMVKVASDVYRCPECGAQVAVMADAPIIEGYQNGYDGVPSRFSASFAS